jgi:hypothetical protein
MVSQSYGGDYVLLNIVSRMTGIEEFETTKLLFLSKWFTDIKEECSKQTWN